MTDATEAPLYTKQVAEADLNESIELGWLKAPADAGLRYNKDKPPLDLVDSLAVTGVARVLAHGAAKYSAHNWRKGLSWSETIASLERHLAEIKRGEIFDKESGEQHIDHLGCNWMFLSNFMKTGGGTNDIPQLSDWVINKPEA